MIIDRFKKEIILGAKVEDVFDWHCRKSAFQRLNPPWEKVKIEKQEGIFEGAITKMKVYEGPVSINWVSKHTKYIQDKCFTDEQLKGPFKIWKHSHFFEKISDNKSKLTDDIEYRMKFYPFSKLMKTHIRNKLERMFTYRHVILKQDIKLLQKYNSTPKNFVISGASGLLGQYLTHFLTTQGHNVVPLSRNNKTDENIFRDFENGSSSSCLNDSDVVIHLAGEPITEGKWSKKKKEMIVKSRVEGTKEIVAQISKLKNPPKLLICASAIGYYGNRDDEILTEESECGNDFISKVCYEWEKSAEPAIEKGIRVVFLRIGIVLTPSGGALKKLLKPFQFGFGTFFGKGNQWMSWILPDDIAGIILHIVANEDIKGAVNVVSPNPVKQLDFTYTLGEVLKKRTIIKIPEKIIKSLFGQKGEELLLSSTRVIPEKLTKSGYEFLYPDLKIALKHITGKS